MATDVTKGGATSFPHQKRSRTEKGKKFYKDCIDSAEVIVDSSYSMGIRASMEEKISNYNLINDIVDPKEINKVINPHKIEAEFYEDYRNYPLINPFINVLIGEERRRFFTPLVTLTNPDLVNIKINESTAMLNEFILKKVTAGIVDEQELSREIQAQGKWQNFNYRDKRERMATQIVQYGYNILNMKEEFSRAFEDLLIAGEEIAIADILGGEPVLRKGNPLNMFTLRSGESYKFEDSDLIIEASYVPVGQAIDDHFDELTPANIKKLEEGYSYNTEANSRLFTRSLRHKEINLDSLIAQVGGIGEVINASKQATSYFGGGFDEFGNVKKVRVVWRGMRKLGVMTYLDENGDEQKQYVDETFPIDEEGGDQVKWIWVGEWYEGTKLADDIYIKMGPRKVQFRSMDNPSKCSPGIVGTIFNVNSSVSKSLISLAKPYQLTYNYFMHKLWEEIRTYKGKIAKIQTSMIPDGWTMDQFLYYIEQMKIAFEDPFNQGNKGAALGKLAGNMNQSGGSIEIGDPNIIKQLLEILNFLELRLQDVTGITPQRKGAIEERETVGGVERSVTQSSMSTEKFFSVHDNFKVRALEAYLETAKIAWKDNKFKRQFILDDGSQAVLDFDGEVFNETEYGVHLTTASTDMEMMQTLRSLVQPFLQNGGSLSMVMDLYRSKDPASLQRKLESYEQQVREDAARQAQQQAEFQQKQMEQMAALEQEKLAQIERASVRDSDIKIEVALIQAESAEGDGEIEETEDPFKERETQVKEDSLSETIRKNRADEALKKEDLKIKKKSANKQPAKT